MSDVELVAGEALLEPGLYSWALVAIEEIHLDRVRMDADYAVPVSGEARGRYYPDATQSKHLTLQWSDVSLS
jgi:hypothetical protein